jgi:prefoldin subunit 5
MEDLRAKLEELQKFFADVKGDLDRLSKEQQELLRAALQRIEAEQIAAIRASIGLTSKQ